MFRYQSAAYFREWAEEKRARAELHPPGSYAHQFWQRQAEAAEINAMHAQGLEDARTLLEHLAKL